LRSLRYHRIGNAVLRIEPEGRIGLDRAGQSDLQRGRDVLFADAQLARLDAVDVHLDGRRVGRLLDARVRHAGHLRNPLQELRRQDAVAVEIIADHLHVDWRGQAEVEDLRDDVGGQKGESRVRKEFRQLFPQTPHQFCAFLFLPSSSVIRMSASAEPIVPELP